jgi:hypothetical protein
MFFGPLYYKDYGPTDLGAAWFKHYRRGRRCESIPLKTAKNPTLGATKALHGRYNFYARLKDGDTIWIERRPPGVQIAFESK